MRGSVADALPDLLDPHRGRRRLRRGPHATCCTASRRPPRRTAPGARPRSTCPMAAAPASARPACCPVVGEDGVTRMVRACTEGPVFRGDRVRWADLGTVPADARGARDGRPHHRPGRAARCRSPVLTAAGLRRHRPRAGAVHRPHRARRLHHPHGHPRPAGRLARRRGSWRRPSGVLTRHRRCRTPACKGSWPPSCRGSRSSRCARSCRSRRRRWGSTASWPAGSATAPA